MQSIEYVPFIQLFLIIEDFLCVQFGNTLLHHLAADDMNNFYKPDWLSSSWFSLNVNVKNIVRKYKSIYSILFILCTQDGDTLFLMAAPNCNVDDLKFVINHGADLQSVIEVSANKYP